MADGRPRRDELKETASSTRRRSGSEIIRKRVAHLLQSSSIPVSLDESPVTSIRDGTDRRSSPLPQSNLNSSVDRYHKPDAKDTPMTLSSNPPRSLKRKKSLTSASQPNHFDKPENRIVHATRTPLASSPHVYSPFVSTPMSRPPPLHSELPPISSVKNGKTVTAKHSSHQPHDSHIGRAYNEANKNDAIRRDVSQEPVFTGPLTVAEFERMKKEIETLKEALHETKKVSKRHCKKLEESKVELNAALLAAQEKESELSIIKNKHKTAEEVLLTIESSIQCQICMDLPDRPFVLSPCGHVLCLSCLQEWFRKAPPTLDDMDIDPDELTDPHYILMRSKSCPSCRATVKSRPVPVFMVKAVSSALRKARPSSAGPGQASASNRPTTTDADNQDPWKGIFLSSEEDEDGDDSDLESESEDEDQQVLIGWYRQRELRRALFPDAESTDSEAEDDDDEDQDEDQDQGENASEDDDDVEQHLHILPRWAPPRMTGTQYTAAEQETSETLKLLQRGCSWEMLRNYDVAYRHNSGIILSLRSLNHLYASDDDSDDEEDCMNRVFLGWNISLDQDDVDGEAFITNILEDIKNNPIRWQVTRRRGVFLGAVDARRLVRADEVEEYDTTDTEVWIDAEEF